MKGSAGKNQKGLVVVESPTKARTIASILGRQYEVKASIGHVRDLPKSELGVDVDGGFQPRYVIPPGKRKALKEIAQAGQRAAVVYLATDPDREGEAIAWHLLEAAKLKGRPHQRVVFHEITPAAVREAFRQPRDLDMRLVEAQQARRVLDRLMGYRLSPFLWRKVKRGLSAGRVQSVALRLVVGREMEIRDFVPREYWTIEAELQPEDRAKAKDGGQSFGAKLAGYIDKKRKLEVSGEAEAQRLVAILREAAYSVTQVQRKRQARRPSPPFITSTLQQEASRRLGFSAKKTMVVAQQLYEGPDKVGVGLITYMRTDSTQVAEEARREARSYIGQRFGKQYLPPSPRAYKRKVKGAQEAHEAIRPTSIRREPDALRPQLSGDQYKLYGLIWQRMLASQMADATFDVTSVDIEARPSVGEDRYLFRASRRQLRFAGYQALYIESAEEGQEEEASKDSLPDLAAGDLLRLLGLEPGQHFTEPPPRYTEATLVKALEEKGIGRPSTYAPILATIQERGYVDRENRQLKPSDLGILVNELLTEYFPDFVDVGFTAEMEEELDEIASGQRPWQPVVQEFYRPLERALAQASKAPPAHQVTDEKCDLCGRPMVIRWGRRGRFLACSGFPECRHSRPLEGEAQAPAPEPTDEVCDQCGSPMVIRTGRFGRFLACSGFPRCHNSRPLEDDTQAPETTDQTCDDCGAPMVVRRGRFGPFLACTRYPDCRGRKPLAARAEA
ncbi:MAG: type I DNA topoisomerase [Dehalococcoidia bacterium]